MTILNGTRVISNDTDADDGREIDDLGSNRHQQLAQLTQGFGIYDFFQFALELRKAGMNKAQIEKMLQSQLLPVLRMSKKLKFLTL